MLHKLLQRQLKHYADLGASTPIPDQWKAFIEAVNEAYEQADADRKLTERSLDLSSHELLDANAKLLERTRDLELALRQLNETQEKMVRAEKLAAVGKLAASVSHELRNPLGTIRNALYYIQDCLEGSSIARENPTLKEFLILADKEIVAATNIIGDLLDFSKVIKLSLEPCKVNVILSDLKTILQIPEGIRIVEETDPTLPAVLADPQRLRQVFINLAVNAFQAMPAGGALTIRTGRTPKTSEIFIVFKDEGTGISPENRAKIFEPLFTTKTQGTGLGLAVCQSIAEAHAGRIIFESEPGKGSVFMFNLPVDGPKNAA